MRKHDIIIIVILIFMNLINGCTEKTDNNSSIVTGYSLFFDPTDNKPFSILIPFPYNWNISNETIYHSLGNYSYKLINNNSQVYIQGYGTVKIGIMESSYPIFNKELFDTTNNTFNVYCEKNENTIITFHFELYVKRISLFSTWKLENGNQTIICGVAQE